MWLALAVVAAIALTTPLAGRADTQLCRQQITPLAKLTNRTVAAELVFALAFQSGDLCGAASVAPLLVRNTELPVHIRSQAQAVIFAATGDVRALEGTNVTFFTSAFRAFNAGDHEQALEHLKNFRASRPNQTVPGSQLFPLDIAANVIRYWSASALTRKQHHQEVQAFYRAQAAQGNAEQATEEEQPTATEESPASANVPRLQLDISPLEGIGVWGGYGQAVEALAAGQTTESHRLIRQWTGTSRLLPTMQWLYIRQALASPAYEQALRGSSASVQWRYLASDEELQQTGVSHNGRYAFMLLTDLVVFSAGLESDVLAQTLIQFGDQDARIDRAFLRLTLFDRLAQFERDADVSALVAPLLDDTSSFHAGEQGVHDPATLKQLAALRSATYYSDKVEALTESIAENEAEAKTIAAAILALDAADTDLDLSSFANSDDLPPNRLDLEEQQAAYHRAIDDERKALAGYTEKAGAMWQEAVDFSPTNPLPYIQHGQWLNGQKQYAEAVAVLSEALASDSPFVNRALIGQLLFNRGISFERLGDWPKAEQDFRSALVEDADNASILNYLGYSLLVEQHGRVDDALEEATAMLERANDLSGNRSAAILDSLGYAYALAGRHAEAVTLLERSVTQLPYSSEVLLHLGDTYLALGRPLEALYQFERALTELPNSYEVINASTLEARIAQARLAVAKKYPPTTKVG